MELEIIKEKENPLFGRKEVQIGVDNQVTPTKDEIKILVAQKFSTQPENISIKGIHGKFGSQSFIINANIYSSSEEREKAEPKKKKGAESQEAPKEEKSAADAGDKKE